MDRVQSLKSKIAADPYDAASWEQLVGERTETRRRTPEHLADLRATYDELLKVFPTAAGYWRDYCEQEIATNSPGAVKALFSRCLLTCLSVDLWRTYLQFIKKINEPKGAEGIDEIRKAYEFTLDRLGQDINSGSLWLEYARFLQVGFQSTLQRNFQQAEQLLVCLQSPKNGTPEYTALFGAAPEGQEELQRIVALRRVYQRAVVVPTSHVDQLWREYEQLENSGSNKTLGRRVLDEWRPKYQAARLLHRERARRSEGINFKALALPPGRGGHVQQAQAGLWREFLAWEKGNPQRLEKQAFVARVALTYDQALMVLLHYPDIWMDYAAWHVQEGGEGGAGVSAAQQVLAKARKALPACLALQFAAADALEVAGSTQKAKDVYEAVVEHLKPVEEGGAAAAAAGEAAGEGAAGAQLLSPDQGTLAWIQYMRFARRAEGIMAARKVFMRARKYPDLRWQAYVASALMEWQHDRKDQIPRNIFELGLKSFLGEAEYVEQYVQFLVGLGDLSNARTLFERALTEAPPEAALKLWDAFLCFEYEVGTNAAIKAVEQRRLEAMGARPHDRLHVNLLKHKVLGLWPATDVQALHFKRVLGMVPPIETPPEKEGPGRGREIPRERDWQGDHGRGERQQHHHHHHHLSSPQQQRPQRGEGGGAPVSPALPSGFGGSGEPEPIRQFPHELGMFINHLPPSHTVEGSVPDVDQVIDVLVKADLTSEGIIAHEIKAARERRRQRRMMEQHGGGGPPGSMAGRGRGGGGPPNKRRAALDAFDEEDSDYEEDGGDGGFGDEDMQSGLDVYRMRRKQLRS